MARNGPRLWDPASGYRSTRLGVPNGVHQTGYQSTVTGVPKHSSQAGRLGAIVARREARRLESQGSRLESQGG